MAYAPDQIEDIRKRIVENVRKVFDPEIPVNIHELGLIYRIDVDPEGKVKIEMTLTSPACPSAQVLPVQVKQGAEAVEEVTGAEVAIVWDPQWTPEMMSEEARIALNMY